LLAVRASRAASAKLFDQGRNAKQVQRWLGHHSAAFTLDTYVHLLSDDLDEPLELPGLQHSGRTEPSGVLMATRG